MDPSDHEFGSFLASYDESDTEESPRPISVNPNNPYRKSNFMSFSAHAVQPQDTAIRRRQTQTRPVNVQDFEKSFQNDQKSHEYLGFSNDSPRSTSTRRDLDGQLSNTTPQTPGSPPFLTRHVSFSRIQSQRNPSVSSFSGFSTLDREDTLDDSDTARLTTNAAGAMPIQPPSPVHYPQTPNYVESNPFGRSDSISVPNIHHTRSLHGITKMIRRVSTRVVNLQNRRSRSDLEEDRMLQLQQEPLTGLLNANERGRLDDDIEMTPVPERQLTPDYDYRKDKKSAQSIGSEASHSVKQILLTGRSCHVFDPDNPLRVALARILAWSWLETLIMVIIALHAIVLFIVFWGSNQNPTPPTSFGETWDQYAIMAIFCFYTLEMVCRIIVYGFFFNPPLVALPKEGVEEDDVMDEKDMTNRTDNPDNTMAYIKPPNAYLRHSWNRVDFLSVIGYWVDLILLLSHQEILGDSQRILVFKMLSAIRLLRLLNVTNGNKIILHSLKKSAPLLVNVMFFVCFFFVIFGIIGVQAFRGSFLRHCVWTDPTNATNVQVLQQYCGGYIENGAVMPFIQKDGSPGLWSKGFICPQGLQCRETENAFGNTVSFDNIFDSMEIVLIIAGVQSWTDRMYDMCDAEYLVASLYFIVIVIIMNFWLINLFVAVINEMFAKVREDSKHSAFTSSRAKPVLNDNEEGWSFREQGQAAKKPKRATWLQQFVKASSPIWVVLVAIDLIVMGCKNFGMSTDELALLDRMELGFTLAFMAEALIRLASYFPEWKSFFNETRNRTDLLIAVVTCIIQLPPIHGNSIAYSWLTGFQIIRIYRVLVAFPRMRAIISRILGSVYGLMNLVFFVVLVTLICGMVAIQLLEGSMNNSGDEMRFYSVYNAFAGLYQLFSGENWTDVLYAAMEAGYPTHNNAVNAIFLCIWFCFSNFVLVNMFIAIIMENFETAEEEKRQRQVQDYLNKNDTMILEDAPIASRWNVFRYLKPKPKGLAVDNMPSGLVLSTQKEYVREFLVDSNRGNAIPVEQPYIKITPDDQSSIYQASVKGSFGNTWQGFKKYFNFEKSYTAYPLKNIRKSMTFDALNPLEILNSGKNRDEFQSTANALQRLQVDPSVLEAFVVRKVENARDDIVERQAQKREFIMAHPMYDKSLWLFSPSNRIRRWCQLIVPSPRGQRTFGTQPSEWYSTIVSSFIFLCVAVNVVLTIYNTPVYQLSQQDNPGRLKLFMYLDWGFTFFFTLEFIIRIIADGFLLTPNAYLLNGWNVLDCFVLITLYMANFGTFALTSWLSRAFRAFKALRALRLINLLPSAKETFSAILVTGLPRILDAAALGLCLIVPFALYGQNIFQGLFYSCNDSGAADISGCTFEASLSMQAPMPNSASIYMPRVWQNPYVYSFDSFWSGLLILFEICSGEGWINVLITSMSIVGLNQNSQTDASQMWGIFFMAYNLAGSIFVISLFLGVVIENFSKRNGTAYLTSDQRRWLDLKKLLSQIRPAKRPKVPPVNKTRRWCFDLVVDKTGKFYKIMTWVITINILVLCTDSVLDDEIQALSVAKRFIYLGFIVVYLFEISVKLLGLGWYSFRQNLWNLYDLVVVFGAAITLIVTLSSSELQLNIEAQKLFMTAICFKLVQRSDSLNQLFTTMAASAYQILNVLAVWLIVMISYAIMFMEIFGLTRYGTQATTEHVNFRSFAVAMVSLVRYSTGEGWNTVMHDFAIEAPNCVDADDFLQSDCGSVAWAYFLFLSFNIISMYIFTGILVAVVSDNFAYVYQIAANFSLVNREEIRKFKNAWAEVDVDRTGYIQQDDYIRFWQKLSGMFDLKTYSEEFSLQNLMQECKSLDSPSFVIDDPYKLKVDVAALNQKLQQVDKREVHQRRRLLNRLFWESVASESSKGISFNNMLLMLAQYKLIVPENALVLEDLLQNAKKQETVEVLVNIERVRGLIWTVVQRKKFLQHLETKKAMEKRARTGLLPAILVDNIHDYTPYNEGTSHNSPVSGSSVAIMSGLASPVSPTNDSALLDYFWHRDFVDPTAIASSNSVSDQEDQSDGARESEDHFGPNNHWQGELK
ncbi:unnamed protein product [Umbelopsis ramanniana]